MEHIMKGGNHSTLVGYFSIFETEGHDRIVEVAHGCSKGSLLGIR